MGQPCPEKRWFKRLNDVKWIKKGWIKWNFFSSACDFGLTAMVAKPVAAGKPTRLFGDWWLDTTLRRTWDGFMIPEALVLRPQCMFSSKTQPKNVAQGCPGWQFWQFLQVQTAPPGCGVWAPDWGIELLDAPDRAWDELGSAWPNDSTATKVPDHDWGFGCLHA